MSELKKGDIVQLDPEHHTHHEGFWAGQLIIVTEVKSWGIQGYAKTEGGLAFYRAKTGTFEKVGTVEWMRADPDE